MFKLLTALLAATALAQTPEMKGEEAPGNYALCLTTARAYPEQGFAMAQKFAALGGSDAAKHCEGIALIGLRRYAEAGQLLETLGKTSGQTREVRAGLLAQAAQAWTLNDDLARAADVQTAALAFFSPGEADSVPLLIDRAVTYGAMKRYDSARADLDAALAIAPKDADALAFRANANRGLGQTDAALKDAEAAVALDAKNTNALLERGIAYRLSGNAEGARRDWQKIITLDPQGETARAAKEHLAKMEEKAP